MLTVDLLETGDWSSGQVPDSVQHISSMDPVVICVFGVGIVTIRLHKQLLQTETRR